MTLRKLFLIAVLPLVNIPAIKAQGSLQFNQVLTYASSVDVNNVAPVWTCPNNKVWKVEGFVSTANGGLMLMFNGVSVQNEYGYSATLNNTLWLKTGDNLQFTYQYTAPQSYWISIIEFNIVQ